MEVALYHPEHGYYRRSARSLRQGRRLLHRRADPAGVRHPDRRAHSPALPRRWASRAISRWWNSAPAGAKWPRPSPSGATFRWMSIPASCPGVSTAWSSRTSSSTRCRWTWRLSRGSFPRAARGARRGGRVRVARGRGGLGARRRLSARYFPAPEEGRWYEVNLDALAWMERIGRVAARPASCSPSITATRAPRRCASPPAR